MPRGAPDYSNVKSGTDLHRLDDLAELPPRFREASSIDRAGEVIVVEDFRYGLVGVEASDAGLGESEVASPLYARYGGFSAKLSRVANANSYAGVGVFTPVIESGKIGAEVSFCIATSAPQVRLFILYYTGDTFIRWGAKWSDQDNKVYLGDDVVGWEETDTGFPMLIDTERFHNLKLVVDADNEDYERLLIDGKAATVIAKDAYSDPSVNPPHVVGVFYNAVGPTDANEVYLDFMVITRNEP